MRIGFERDVPATQQLDGWQNGTFQQCGVSVRPSHLDLPAISVVVVSPG